MVEADEGSPVCTLNKEDSENNNDILDLDGLWELLDAPSQVDSPFFSFFSFYISEYIVRLIVLEFMIIFPWLIRNFEDDGAQFTVS